jgi:hypothetical protein
MTKLPDDHAADSQEPQDTPGGRAAERLRSFLEKRMSPEEAEAELERQTSLRRENEKESVKSESGPDELTKPKK